MNAPGNPKPLSSAEILRYGRHLVLPEVGLAGQSRLRDASVVLVGAGGLGSPVALYLAAAGIGRIGLVDHDTIELSNLQRQVLYGTADVGRAKLAVARERIEALNPLVHVETHEARLVESNALEILRGYDVVVDGTDNFAARYLVNDACLLLDRPNVYGSIFRFEGQVSVFWRGRGPCYRCLFPDPPPPGSVPNCAEGGVLGVLPGIVGALQATETIKLVLGRGETLIGRLLLVDALEMRFRELTLRPDARCAACGEGARMVLCDLPEPCAPTDQASDEGWDIPVDELDRRLRRGELPRLIDVRTPEEWSICRLPGALSIPLRELDRRLGELDLAEEIVVYCHVGVRSSRAVTLLRERGFRAARNLAGGIDAWATRIDPRMPRY